MQVEIQFITEADSELRKNCQLHLKTKSPRQIMSYWRHQILNWTGQNAYGLPKMLIVLR